MNRSKYDSRPRFAARGGDLLTRACQRYIGRLVRWLDGDFHPDTPFDQHYDTEGCRTFSDKQAFELQTEFDAVVLYMEGIDLSVHVVALEALHVHLLTPPRAARRCTYPYQAEAWHRGFEAHYAGENEDDCPYTYYSTSGGNNKRAWTDGRRAAAKMKGTA